MALDQGIAVQQVALVDHESTDTDWQPQVQHVAVAMRADRGTCKDGVFERSDLFEIAARAISDEPRRSKGLVCRAHYFAKDSGRRGIVEILEYDHGGTGQLSELVELFLDAAVSVSARGRRVGSKTGGRGETDHGSKLGEVRLDSSIHVAPIARANIEQLNHIADRRCVVFGEFREYFWVHRGQP